MPKGRRLQAPAKTRKATSPIKARRPHKFLGLALKPLKIFRIFRFLVPPYVKNSFKELRQVTWPSRKETLKLTFAVFMFAIIFGAMITLVDFGLDKLFKRILLR